MLSHNDKTGEDAVPDYPQPKWARSVLLGVVFIGSVVGMLTMGYLGDLLGVQRGLIITNWFIVSGSLASALLSWGDSEVIWMVIAMGRFVLGIGVGGAYPLSAAKAAEAGVAKEDASEAVTRAGRAFFWQGPGSMTPYVLAVPLLKFLPREDGVTSLQFRILLGLGALPALIVLLASMAEAPRDHTAVPTDKMDDPKPSGEDHSLSESLRDLRHWKALVGTAGGWFLFDVAFYGTVMFAPDILDSIFEGEGSLTKTSICAAIMAGVGILGTACGLAALPVIGAKKLNIIGFSFSAMLFAAFAVFDAMLKDLHVILFALLCFLMVALYSGPNIATFVLPVMAFPPDVRGTFHGLSAAAAKLGAMAGTLMFPNINNAFGVLPVMAMQAVLCVLGALVSCFFLDDLKHGDAQSEDTIELRYSTSQRIGVGIEGTSLKDNREAENSSLYPLGLRDDGPPLGSDEDLTYGS